MYSHVVRGRSLLINNACLNARSVADHEAVACSLTENVLTLQKPRLTYGCDIDTVKEDVGFCQGQ